jgi:nucleotide-binding universal stress UspA family protein
MVRLAKSSQGSILLLHAVTPAESFAMSAGEFVAHERKRSAEYLARLAERFGEEGIGIEERIVTGEPSRAIASIAGRDKVDLIAMSTHGRSGIREWVFGSVAERVLRSTQRPVLLFRGKPDRRFEIRKILVPLDGSKDALEILQPVGQLADSMQAEVQLLHVGKDLPEAIKGAMLALTRRRIPHRTVLRQSKNPAGAILGYARESQADLVAMTPTGGSGSGRVSFGSVAEAILKDADRPILMIRAGQKR